MFKQISVTAASLLLLFVSSVAQADIYYDWVETSGLGGSGFMRLAETNITDPANFDVFFTPQNVLEIQFDFGRGLSTQSVANYDSGLSLQTDPELNDGSHELVAFNGVIDPGWVFLVDYSTDPAAYVDASDTDLICVVAPCSLFNVEVIFSDISGRDISRGHFELRPVPLPPAWFLAASAFIGLRRFMVRHH